jgi:hypothetical protein
MSNPRVLLTTLSVRTSAKGNAYLAGWLGKASVVAFQGEPDRFGNPTWDLYLSEPEPRDRPAAATAPQKPASAPQERPAGVLPLEDSMRAAGARDRASCSPPQRHTHERPDSARGGGHPRIA